MHNLRIRKELFWFKNIWNKFSEILLLFFDSKGKIFLKILQKFELLRLTK